MENYIEIEIGGKLRGWLFNNLAYRSFISTIGGKDYFSVAPCAMLYAGLYSNAIIKEIPVDFTFGKVCEWADELADNNPDIIKKMDDIFTESTQFKKLIGEVKSVSEELNTEEEKKNISTDALVSPQED